MVAENVRPDRLPESLAVLRELDAPLLSDRVCFVRALQRRRRGKRLPDLFDEYARAFVAVTWQHFDDNVQDCHSWCAVVPGTLADMRFLARIREFLATQHELAQRQALLDRPWEEDLLHWAFDGREWHLHGHLAPPPNRRRYSTTTSGWCPGLRVARSRADDVRLRENS